MSKYFYSSDVSIIIELIDSFRMTGILQSRKLGMHSYEFEGLYCNNEPNIDLSFFINWNLRNRDSEAFSAFTGVIEPRQELEILYLNWLSVAEDKEEESFPANGSVILTSNNYLEGQYLTNNEKSILFKC